MVSALGTLSLCFSVCVFLCTESACVCMFMCVCLFVQGRYFLCNYLGGCNRTLRLFLISRFCVGRPCWTALSAMYGLWQSCPPKSWLNRYHLKGVGFCGPYFSPPHTGILEWASLRTVLAKRQTQENELVATTFCSHC